ncbi:hypothetical protein HOC80_04815 [archaeon]|jgi:hypothetical protein|nr:hypothetical protein [archaeon]MBT4417395.1 hypothetical protein [archaeon]
MDELYQILTFTSDYLGWGISIGSSVAMLGIVYKSARENNRWREDNREFLQSLPRLEKRVDNPRIFSD